MWYQSLVALDLGRRIAPYTPQQNGVAEKKNRVLQDMINVVLVSANLPKNLWGEALLTVCHLITAIDLAIVMEKSEITNMAMPLFSGKDSGEEGGGLSMVELKVYRVKTGWSTRELCWGEKGAGKTVLSITGKGFGGLTLLAPQGYRGYCSARPCYVTVWGFGNITPQGLYNPPRVI
ncbi:zinc finger, CCHC-type containing protein [Tanacetum coccineum]